MKLRSTLLFAAASLSAAALAPVAASMLSVPAYAATATLTSTTTTISESDAATYGIAAGTYSGNIIELTAAGSTGFHDGTFTIYNTDASGTISTTAGVVGTTSTALTNQGVAGSGQTLWNYFVGNGSTLSSDYTYGETLYVSADTLSAGNLTANMTFGPAAFGGLVVGASDNTFETGRTGSNIQMQFAGASGSGVVFNIASNTKLHAGSGFVASGNQNWTIASGKTLSLLNNSTGGGTLTLNENCSMEVSGGGALSVGGIVTSSGATLTIGAETTLALSGTANIAGTTTVTGGTLDLSGGNITLASTIQNSGTVTMNSSTTFVLGDALNSNGTWTVFSGSGSLTGWDSTTLGAGNFRKSDGSAFGGRSTVEFSAGTVTISEVVFDLFWKGGETGTWDTTDGTVWGKDSVSGPDTAFVNGDNVTFESSANITVSAGISAGVVSVKGTGTTITLINQTNLTAQAVNIAAGAKLDVGNLSEDGQNINLNLQGSGEFSASKTSGNHDFIVNIGTDFTGTVNYSGRLNQANATLGADTATVNLTDVFFWSTGTGTLAQTLNITGENSKLTKGTLNLTGTVTAEKFTLSGGTLNISGSADFARMTQSGGTLTFSGTSTLGAISQTAGTLNFNGADMTIASYKGPTSAGGGTNPVTNVGAGANLTVTGEFYLRYQGNGTSTLNVDGNMVVGGALNLSRDGNGIVNVRDGGTLVAASIGFGQNWPGVDNKSSVVNVESGGTLVVGAMTKLFNNINGSSLNLNGGTLGTTANSLRISVDSLPIVLGADTTSTINTGKYDTATKTFTDTGTEIFIANAISGDGALKKAGSGTLTLSGANTYTGTTTVFAGTLVAGNASALGNGNVSIADGATLKRGVTGALNVGGTFTTEGAAKLVLGELNTTTAAIVAGGDVTLSAGTIFDLDSIVTNGKLISGTGLSTDGLGIANIYVGGKLVNQRGNATFSVTDNALVLSAYTAGEAWNITWNGGDAGVWKANGSGWTKDGDSTAANFQNGDSVTFGTDTTNTATLEGSLNVGALTISAATSFTGTGTVRVDAANLTTTAALTLGDNVVLDLGSSASATNKNILGSGTVKFTSTATGHGGTLTLGSGFSGTIEYSGKFSTRNGTYNSNAKFALSNGSMWGDNTIANDIHFLTNYQLGDTTATTIVLNGNLTQEAGTTLNIGTNANTNITFGGAGTVISDLRISAGKLTMNAGQATIKGSQSLSGDLEINSGATVNVGQNDSLNYGATNTVTVNQGGVLDFGAYRWTVGQNNKIVINGGEISGAGEGNNGALDFYQANTAAVTASAGSTSTISAAIRLRNVAATFTVEDGAKLTLSGLINGGGTLVKAGTGELVVSGTNTYTGGTTISAGTLVAASASALGTGAVTVASGAVLELAATTGTVSNVIAGAGSVEKTGAGTTTTLSGANTFTGGLTVTDGTLVVTQDAALGGDANAISVAENGTLELGFGGDFARSVSGAGTLAKSGDAELILKQASAETLSLCVKGGTLTADFAGGSLNKLSAVAGATFKANQDVSFVSVESFSGKLTGASASTRVSVSEGAFAGTLEHVSLVKTGATGTLDMSGALFATGGTFVVEGGTVSNLTLAGGGTLAFETTADASATMSNLTIYGGTTISIAEAFTGVAAASLTDTLTLTDISDASRLTLEFRSIGFKEDYKVFTFTDEGKSAWETAFGTLDTTTGKFSSGNLTLAGIATDEAGKFSWQTNDDGTHTLLFQEDRDSETYYWRGNGGNPLWAFEANWNPNAFASGNAAVFDKDSLVAGAAFVLVDSSVNANSVTIDLLTGAEEGATGEVTIQEWDGGSMLVREGITVRSGVLKFIFVNEDFYRNAFIVEGAGVLHVTRPLQDVTLANDLSGTGVVRYADDTRTLTLSGDRSGFTGTLDVQAGTVVLAGNASGEEVFGTVRIAEGAKVSATGSAGAVYTDPDGWGSYNVSKLSFTSVEGAGTLVVNSPVALGEKTFFSLDLTGSAFAGTVELNAIDLAVGTESHFAEVSASNLGAASVVRLMNGSSLNFFNEAATFAHDVEVAENGSVRVYGGNAGATISGDVYGAGTLTVKDGGKLILSGSVGTLGDDDTPAKTLGGLTLASGSLEITGAEMNVAGDVSLAGTAKIAAANGRIGGSVSMSGAGGLELGGTLEVVGGVSRAEASGQDGHTTTILAGAEVSVGGNMSFGNYENLVLEDGANLSVTGSLTNQWGFNATLGAGATLSAGTLASTTIWDEGRFLSFVGTGENVLVRADAISLNSGWGAGNQNARANFENLRLEIGAAGIDNAGFDTNWVRLKDVTLGVLGDADGWSTGAALKLNGGTTTFETAEGKTITLNGAVSEAADDTSSSLVKTGAGTLVLTQSNLNKGGTTVSEGTLEYSLAGGTYDQAQVSVTVGDVSFDRGAGLAVGENGTLKFSGASEVEIGSAAGTAVLNFEQGGVLKAASGTTIKIGQAGLLSGDVTFSSEGTGANRGKLSFADTTGATSVVRAGDSLTVSGGIVSIENGATLTVAGTLTLSGTSAQTWTTVGGDGTLKLDGTLATNTDAARLDVSSAIEFGADAVIDTAKGNLRLTGEIQESAGSTLTKRGGNELIFNSSIGAFSGALVVEAGKVTLDAGDVLQNASALTILSGAEFSGTVTMAGAEKTFTLAGGTLTGNAVFTGTELKFGADGVEGAAPSSKIVGDLTISGTEITMNGDLISVTTFTWNNRNAITLSEAFSKSVVGSHTLIDFEASNLGTVDLATQADFDAGTEAYGRRTLALSYNAANTSLDVISTGTLIWNEGVNEWKVGVPETSEENLWTLEEAGSTDTKTAFRANDYVMFLESGEVAVADAEILTSGMVFNLEENEDGSAGSFVISSTAEFGAVLKDADVGANAGLSVISGNVQIAETVRNEMKAGVYIYGGSLTVANADSLGSTEADAKGVFLSGGALGFVKPSSAGEDEAAIAVGQKVTIGAADQAATVGIDVGAADLTVTIANALVKADADSTANLVKTGAGTLEITRDSAADALSVDEGTVRLTGGAALGVKNVVVAGTLTLNGDDADGADTAFESVILDGGKIAVNGGAYRAEAISGSGEIAGALAVGAVELDGSGAVTKGTVVLTDDVLVLKGGISSYEQDGALVKSGAGTLALQGADENVGATIDAGIALDQGTLELTYGGTVSGVVETTGDAVKIRFGGTDATRVDAASAELAGGLILASGTNLTFSNTTTAGTLTVNGVALAEADAGNVRTTFDGGDYVIAGTAADFGKIDAADKMSVTALANGATVTVSAETFKAGALVLSDASTLTLGADNTSAEVGAIAVDRDETASIDLAGKTLTVTGAAGVSALQGSGTLTLVGEKDAAGELLGGLVVEGSGTYAGALYLELSDAKFTFDVGNDETAQAALNNVSTTEGRTGAVVKQGEGTLVVYGDRTGDLSFDGTIAVEGGVMELQTRASRAEIAIDAGSTLRFHGFAATRVNGDVNGTTYSAPLAENLTGAGTLEITGALLTNRDEAGASGLENFNGRLVATGGRDGGFILGGAALADWESNGATGAARDVVLRNGGTLVFGGSDETSANTLKHVSVDGAGTIIANARETVVDTFTKIDATAGSTLTLEGQGVANEIVFALDDAGSAAGTLRAANADWTLTGANSGLRRIDVSSARIVVADAGALSAGTADVSVTNGSVGFSGAVGTATFTNDFTFGGNAEVRAAGGADVTLSGDFSAAMSASSVVFAATTTEEGVGSSLSLSESALGLAAAGTTFSADAASTVSVTVGADSSKALGNGRTLSGAGTFEKTGAGTLTIGSDAGAIGTLKASAGTLALETGAALAAAEGGDAEIVSEAGAAVTIAQAVNLSAFTLTGAGDITITSGTADSQATEVGGIADATAVKVSRGTLKVGGNVSGSAITFEVGTALETTGGNVSVSGTTLAGASLKLINSASDGVVTYGDDVTLYGTTELTLQAAGGKIGGAFKAAYSGNLTKTGDGTWTVTNYTFGAAADQALSVNAGTLIWESAKFDGVAATLTVNENATLQVLSLAGTSNTLNGEIGGNGTLQIMDCGTVSNALLMNATAAQGSAWMLRLSGTSYVVATAALPGSLIVEDSATGVLDFADDAEMGDGRRVYVEAGSTLIKRAAGTLTLGGGSVKHQIGGTLSVEGGTVEQSGAVTWIYGSVLDIEGGATFAVNLADFGGTPSMNVAKLTGTGTFAVESTANEKAYTLGGIVGGFAGDVKIFDGATLKLTRETFANAATEIEGTLRVAISSTSAEGRALTNLSGSGELVIEAPDDERILYAVHDYDTASNTGFTGKVLVKSGVLALDADEVAGMAATVKIGDENSAAARYGENGEYSGILQGGFLQVRNDAGASAYDVSGVFGNSKYEFTAKGGAVFSGGEFKAEADFGEHDTNLFVTAGAGTKLTLLNGASVTGGMFVGHDTTLRLGEERASAAGTVTPPAVSTTFAASALSSATGGNSSVSGDFSLNGTLSIRVDSAALASGALLGVGGNVRVNEDRGDTARIILDLDESVSLDSGVVRVLGGNFVGDTNALNSLVEVEDSTGQTWLISRDPNGNLVLRNATTEYSDVPSGLSGLYAVVKDSALGEFIQSDLGRSTERLVALSPVSFGSLLEMQSGFASLENDLLRERLEQRRYERAVAGDGNTGFKPFVNVFGADREGDGDGTDAANYDVTHAGVLGGFDVAVSSNTIFGVSVGADWAKASLHDGAGKHEGDGSRLGIYGMSQFENAYFGYGLSAGGMSFDTKRNTGYNGETVRGQADGNDVNASFLLGAGWTLGGGLDFAPFVGLDVGYAHTKAFKETGGRETALSVESAERWSLRGKVGAALSWRASERLRLGVEASFAHEFLDTDADIDASFASGTLRGSKFTSTAYLMDENTIQVGPRVDFRIDETWSLSAAYTFETDLDETTTHSANVGLRARF